MTAKLQTKAWLGIEYETNDHGNWVVEEVYADSPAQKAGFEKGDVLLAIDDVKYSKDNKEALSAVYAGLKPGSSATYWVKRQGEKVKLEATLGSVPKDLQAKWINEHMAKDHPEYQMASK
jgi:S1-C subfamily serine protease